MSYLTAETQQRHFITRSSYEGAWDKLVNVMDGFGSYRYPDGSEYRGRFHQGQFHGYGHLRLAQPYRFTVKGEFEHGRLVTVEDMWFSDGLHVEGRFAGSKLECDDWDYLTPSDRRYHSERRYGQQPVGPTAFITAKMLPRDIPPHCYDVEEGLFNSKTCWLTDRPGPFRGTMYVGCKRDKDWIKRHCRKARTAHLSEPASSFCRHIIANNLATERTQMRRTAIYAPNGEVHRERYYHKLTKQRGHPEEPLQTAPLSSVRNDDPAYETEMCVRAYARMLDKRQRDQQEYQKLHPCAKMEKITGPREWTSTSDVRNPESGGASSCQSESFGEQSLPINVTDAYRSAHTMMQKRPADNINVVQSNLIRHNSYMDMTRSIFEL
uniref:MORN repeat-containing protein 5 n=1 Tax=Drosophila rhopaloa TaxID=1041015 RepID=A0A6P4EH02_DRORH